MEHTDKMQLVPINLDFKDQITQIIIKVIDLYDKGMINKDLNIKVGNNFDKETNIVKEILNGKGVISNENDNNNNNKTPMIYSKISPVQIRMNKNKKLNWIF